MAKIFVLAGTGEGRDFAALRPAGVRLTFSFTTRIGADLLDLEQVEKRIGPLDRKEMAALLQSGGYDGLVDLSHPYAVAASANAKGACLDCKKPYYRYRRPDFRPEGKNVRYFADYESAADHLANTEGNLFFAIGSKNMHRFFRRPELKERCYFRVLAASHILKGLEEIGVNPRRIFAMGGVATAELNIALLRMTQAAFLVTKEAGLAGGMKEKAAAAEALGIGLIVIERPKDEGISSYQEIWSKIKEDCNG